MTKPQSSIVIRARRSGSTEKRVTRSLLVPRVIDFPGNVIEKGWVPPGWICVNRNPSSPALPFVNFSMPIRKRESACAAMIGSGNIAPGIRIHVHNEKAVVDRVALFIECQPGHSWLWNIGLFQELPILWVEPGPAIAVVAPAILQPPTPAE